MPRYSSFGGLDTQMVQAGDSFFSTINNRLRPDQLQPGQVAYAQNMRMDVDGAAQPRKGVDAFGPVVEDNGDAITLPFHLYGDTTISAASRVDDMVEVTVDDPLLDYGFTLKETTDNDNHYITQLTPFGSSIVRTFTIFAKQDQRNMISLQVAKDTLNSAGVVFSLVDGSAVSNSTVGNPGTVDFDSAISYNGYVRVALSISDWSASSRVRVYVINEEGAESYEGDPANGVYIFGASLDETDVTTALARPFEKTLGTAGTYNKLLYSNDFTDASWIAVRSTPASTTTIGPSQYYSGSVGYFSGMSGSVEPDGNHAFTITGPQTVEYTIEGATGSETYTLSSAKIGSPTLVVPAESFGSCLFSDPSNDNAEYIIIALRDKAVAVSLADGTSSDIAYPAGIELTSTVNLLQVFGTVGILRDGATALEWSGSFSGTPAFTKVANGTYTANVYLHAPSNTVISNGTVTVSETGHGLSVGQKIYVIDVGTSSLTPNDGGYVVATVPTANSFTFYAEVEDMSAHSVVYSRKVSEGLGFSHMPAPPWASYHQRRLIVPYFYTTTGSSGSEVITDRNIRDELLISDILDGDTYDVLVNAFRVTAGVADYLQWVHPFTDDNAIAFNRNSMHLISGLSGALTDISIKEITREAGLVAQKSVITIGSKIYFLSDNGLYAAEFGELYLLRGAGLPLSDPINPIIQRINSAHAHKAVAIYHDNRYWLAVPLDNSSVNNAILVFNVPNSTTHGGVFTYGQCLA